MIYILIAVVLALSAIIILSCFLKKQSKKKKILKSFEEKYLDLLRMEALNKAIVSPYDLNNTQSGPRKILVKLEQKSELTNKEYLLDMQQPWIIGRKPGEHVICIRGDKTVSSSHCMIREKNNQIYLVDMGSKNPVLYKPKSKIGNKGLYLRSKAAHLLTTGDVFCVGYTSFKVTVFDSGRGIV